MSNTAKSFFIASLMCRSLGSSRSDGHSYARHPKYFGSLCVSMLFKRSRTYFSRWSGRTPQEHRENGREQDRQGHRRHDGASSSTAYSVHFVAQVESDLYELDTEHQLRRIRTTGNRCLWRGAIALGHLPHGMSSSIFSMNICMRVFFFLLPCSIVANEPCFCVKITSNYYILYKHHYIRSNSI